MRKLPNLQVDACLLSGRHIVAKIILLRGNHVGSTWFVVYLKGVYIGTLPPKKVPKQKTCPTPRKWVINDYSLLNCITAKKWEILYSITIKMTCIIGKRIKTAYKTFKQFFDSSNIL
jgi:hypothetical protein